MTETPVTTVETQPEYRHHQPSRLYRVLAWVGIVVGVLFIVGMIFFAGVFFGSMARGYHGGHRGYPGGQMGPNGSMDMDGCPMMRQGGMGPGGMMGPGMMGPGGMGPGGMMGPGQTPTSTMPTPPFTQRPS